MTSDNLQMSSPQNGANSANHSIDCVLTGADIRLLAELGMIGARRGLHSQAQAIFTALCVLRPQRALPIIGLAVDAMYRGQFLDASQILESAACMTTQYPPEELALLKGFHAFALCLGGYRAAGRQVAQSLDSQTLDAELATLLQLCV